MTVNVTKPSLNLREEIAKANKPSGIAGEALLRADSVQDARDQLNVGRKNLIINGGFDVWQRGTSFTGDGYSTDRCYSYAATRGDTVSRSTDVPTGEGFLYSYEVVMTQSHGHPLYRQRIENFSTVCPNSKTKAISFWAKASVPMNINSDLGDVGTTIHSITTAWKRFTAIIPANSNPTYDALDIQANSVAGTLWITGVQLELGSVATDFEHRSYGEELALAQRYFQKIGGGSYVSIGNAINYYNGPRSFTNVQYIRTMRANPTISIDGTLVATNRISYDTDITGIFTSNIGKDSAWIAFNRSSTSGALYDYEQVVVKNGTTAYLLLDAEL